MTFLIRDWCYPYEAPYGYQGGTNLMDRRFEIKDQQHSELKDLRLNLKKCFKTLNCFLMPHPGLRVCTSPEFDGKLKGKSFQLTVSFQQTSCCIALSTLSDIEKEFKSYVQEFVESTFTPNLSLKQINGREITTYELFEYFKAYCRVFEADELPEPKSMLLATAEANNLAAKAIAKEFYIHAMEQVRRKIC